MPQWGGERGAAVVAGRRHHHGVIALQLAGLLQHDIAMGPTTADFHVAFILVALLTAISTLDALTLPQDAGAVVSGREAPTG
jgi:hypothetical protein